MRIIDTLGVNVYDPCNLLAEPTGRVFRSRLPNVGTEIQLASGTAYFVYVGRTDRPMMPSGVEFYVSTAGAGTNTVEVGLFYTLEAPNNQDQTLYRLTAVGTGDMASLLTTGVKWNNPLPFTYTVMPGTYLWAGIRTASYSTQPKLGGLCMDYNEGLVLTTGSANALTGTGPWTGTRPSPSPYWNSTIAPDLRVRWNPS